MSKESLSAAVAAAGRGPIAKFAAELGLPERYLYRAWNNDRHRKALEAVLRGDLDFTGREDEFLAIAFYTKNKLEG